ncbi:uncharacterized protein LOC142226026 [Haematobia irritans]|uniref:uncharacterized protein LOC142226026 n=1 Tax=Haematobia irritans TaxID=7368 RepID=UPI003F50D2FC
MVKSSEISKSWEESVRESTFPYRQAVGGLMYLLLGSSPDLAYSIGFLSRTLESPSSEDVMRVKRVFRYNNPKLECFSDADFGGCMKTGRSTSGVIIEIAGGAVLGSAKDNQW